MLLSNLEYISLRLLRRHLFTDAFLLRFGKLVPYYRVNLNQCDPRPVVDQYARHLATVGFVPTGRPVLEIGVGATNSTGYELAARFAPKSVLLLEPFVLLDTAADRILRSAVAAQHGQREDAISASVRRVPTLDEVPDSSVDLVLSNSVLEHVADPPALFRELKRVLAPGGAMLHLVDYRDHFFKYPYHFLQFSKQTWNRWLNPGDLPVWRFYDHDEQMNAVGFKVHVLQEDRDVIAFARIRPRLAADYRSDDPRLDIATAAFWATQHCA
jgi:SAM-dependent methyltransferase